MSAQQGRGESVWLGWFLHTVLWEFAKVAAQRGEHVVIAEKRGGST